MKNKTEKKNKPAKLALVNDAGLTESELQAGAAIVNASPAIKTAFEEYRSAEGEYLSRFWKLALALRAPIAKAGVVTRLNSREVKLALLSLGEGKTRISEWKRVIEMNDDDFERCRTAGFSKLETLGVARGTLAIEGDGEEAEAVSVHKEKPTATPAKEQPAYHKFPKTMVDAILAAFEGLKPTSDGVAYELKHETAEGVTFDIRVFCDAKPFLPKAQ